MAVLYLTERDVRELVGIEEALQVVERVFARLGTGEATNMPRYRLRGAETMLHLLAGVDRAEGQLGWKIYATTRTGARFLVGLYDDATGELTALIEADFLGQLRTAAASGVSAKYLANESASRLGVIGTGLQARTQAWALAAVRRPTEVRVYGRAAERREAFARQLQTDLGIAVTPVDSAGEVVRNSDLLVTATTSKTPVFAGEDLQPGTHLCAIGSNFLKKTELDLETFRRVSLVCCDSREQCEREAGDFREPLETGLLAWDQVRELSEVLAGNCHRPSEEAITLFKSVGLGVQDIALSQLLLTRAREQGRGTALPF